MSTSRRKNEWLDGPKILRLADSGISLEILAERFSTTKARIEKVLGRERAKKKGAEAP